MNLQPFFQEVNERYQRDRKTFLIGAVVLCIVSAGIFYLIITGHLRGSSQVGQVVASDATGTVMLVPRHLDGMMVPEGEEHLPTRAVMVENYIAARPLSGPAHASVAIESPVEGGITRFLLLFDATSTVDKIGPVRSARPYFVDWAEGWAASFFHVGGSPDALQHIASLGSNFVDVNEMHQGEDFWRSVDRAAPHNTYTSSSLIMRATSGTASRVASLWWHFQDMASSTKRGQVNTIKIPYGGNYNVVWKFDTERDVYVRYQAGQAEVDSDGTPVESENVIVLRTDSQVLDEIGRLKIRTIGSGDAVVYHDGNKHNVRWRRSAHEPIHFETTDGTEILLTRGRTWIEVTTDDLVFAGLGK